jgi:hypothetical protein
VGKLRAQAEAVSRGRLTPAKPLLQGLVDAARAAQSDTFWYRGVQFRLRRGVIWLKICSAKGRPVVAVLGREVLP